MSTDGRDCKSSAITAKIGGMFQQIYFYAVAVDGRQRRKLINKYAANKPARVINLTTAFEIRIDNNIAVHKSASFFLHVTK